MLKLVSRRAAKNLARVVAGLSAGLRLFALTRRGSTAMTRL